MFSKQVTSHLNKWWPSSISNTFKWLNSICFPVVDTRTHFSEVPLQSSPILQSRSGKEWRCFCRRRFVLSISLPQLNNSQTHLPGTELEIHINSVLIFCFYVGLHLFRHTREVFEFCCKYFFHRVPVLLEFWDRDKTKSQNVLIGASQLNLSDTLAMEQTRAVVSIGMELPSSLLI